MITDMIYQIGEKLVLDWSPEQIAGWLKREKVVSDICDYWYTLSLDNTVLMTCYIKSTCPQCKDDHIMKAGRNTRGEQRYRCQNPSCPTKTFMLSYRYRAYKPSIKDQVVAMTINGSGIRDTGRILGIDKQTVMTTLKKSLQPCAGQLQNP